MSAAVLATGEQRDAAGDTVTQAASRSIGAQADRAVALHDETQALLTPLRETIAEPGWEVQSGGFTIYESSCERRAAQCYGFDIIYTNDFVPEGVEIADLAAVLASDGWEVSEKSTSLTATNAAGYRVDVDLGRAGAWVELGTPTWWGDSYEIGQELEARGSAGGAPAETYAFDEWPPLR